MPNQKVNVRMDLDEYMFLRQTLAYLYMVEDDPKLAAQYKKMRKSLDDFTMAREAV